MSPAYAATLCTGGPARARKSPATPQASSTGMVAAEMNSPHTLRRGNPARSISATDQPTCARSRAAVPPAGPLPITAASNRIALGREEMGEGKRQSFPYSPTFTGP